MLTIVLGLAAADPAVDVERLVASARQATAVAVRCSAQAEPGEVTVCGRRRSDRYRLPLAGGTGGTRLDPTPAERVALLTPASKCEEMSVFLVGCGSVGVGVSVSSDGRRRVFTQRELSP